ncbi:putative sarcosine oxidase [Zea mays]|uniref:Putative sarcosine oxidase n=1 Tax=Zea mays TaxID=4577 RepID=A0A1D6I7L0_MAIZE|nr:putative sarcosine oxidase [Zea mays]
MSKCVLCLPTCLLSVFWVVGFKKQKCAHLLSVFCRLQ